MLNNFFQECDVMNYIRETCGCCGKILITFQKKLIDCYSIFAFVTQFSCLFQTVKRDAVPWILCL